MPDQERRRRVDATVADRVAFQLAFGAYTGDAMIVDEVAALEAQLAQAKEALAELVNAVHIPCINGTVAPSIDVVNKALAALTSPTRNEAPPSSV